MGSEQKFSESDQKNPAKSIARRFVAARLKRQSVPRFPGPFPPDLAFAYQCQVEAIRLWPDQIVGWKVGSIRGEAAHECGANRLLGPIFGKAVRSFSSGDRIEFNAFDGGFAAVEPEYVFQLGDVVNSGVGQAPVKSIKDIVKKVYFGVEIAGSPFSEINDHGPPVVVSDFGNNDGLMLGPEMKSWRDTAFEKWRAALSVDGKLLGSGSVTDLEGGPFESLRFAMKQAASMGFPLRSGSLVSTGAITGVHRFHIGQFASADFVDGVRLELMAVA